jgi:hypothetical protein
MLVVASCIRILLLLLCVLLGPSVAEDIRSIKMSVMTGWEFECTDTTCLPFANVIASSVRECQILCLAQVQCQAASFQQSTSSCKLFATIPNQNGDMAVDVETTTMIVISQARTLLG